ncbi:MAG: T9SS type A sorting domain-containing protein [Bacteroidota bacterium]
MRHATLVLFALVCALTLGLAAGPAHAQLFSAYAEGATNPNAWLTDVTDGSFAEFDSPSANAVADDEVNRRIYYVIEGGTLSDMRLAYLPVSESGDFLDPVGIGLMFDQDGLRLNRTVGLAFGNGVLYAANSGPGSGGAPRGLYRVDPGSGDATFLFDPTFQNEPVVFRGLGFNDVDGLLYGVSALGDGSSLFAVDLGTGSVTEVVDLAEAPGSFEGFDGVGIGGNRAYLTFGPSAVNIQVYNLGTGLFENPLPNPPRGENGSGGATYASFLGLTGLTFEASATSPLTVAPGGSVSFDFTVTNATGSSLFGDFFFTAQTASGTTATEGRIVAARTLPDGATAQGSYTQRVPGNAPPGTYTYRLRIGTFPTTTVAEEVFTVTVTGAARAGDDAAWLVEDAALHLQQTEAAPTARSSAVAVQLRAYPNPFTGRTTVGFTVPEAGPARVAVFDVLGREVAMLADGPLAAGQHEVVLDGAALPSGVYVVRLTTESQTLTRRVTLIR